MKKGDKYNWKYQKERLVYLGKSGSWHQFAKVESPHIVWCEVLTSDLNRLEETTVTLKDDYDMGWESCCSGDDLDESQSDEFKQGYLDAHQVYWAHLED